MRVARPVLAVARSRRLSPLRTATRWPDVPFAHRVGAGFVALHASRRTSVRAAVDVMGGDHAPAAILRGCWDAAPLLDRDDRIYLVGDEGVIRDGLASSG